MFNADSKNFICTYFHVDCHSAMPDRGSAVQPTGARWRRCFATNRCPIAAVLCGPQMPDRGGASRPTDARSRRCCADYARPTLSTRSRRPREEFCSIESARKRWCPGGLPARTPPL
ncbi:hypothetical protein Y032_0453g1708 [Ancylostoma ceylanicum]|uniref:Uncharacterized protein n=1 Tax=Ancylostoma ceylanicum TaxID=53326 RepID=A0A016X0B1_9BILA|nr:hypothetical protein Y032_0453g1708 [Ancylostoma ceylanicum]